MDEEWSEIDPELYEAVREGLADATGIHPDFLNDNDIDVNIMCWHVREIAKENVAKIVKALNACGLNFEQKKFIEKYLERYSVSE